MKAGYKINQKPVLGVNTIVVANFSCLNEIGNYYFFGKQSKTINESAIGQWIIKYKNQ